MLKDPFRVGMPTLDFERPRGAVGDTVGYLFDPFRLRDLFAPDGMGDAIGFGSEAFAVALMDKDAANSIVIARHYSRRIYLGSTLHLGVWIDRELVGVLQFGFAMNPASAPSVVGGTAMNEYLELNRMWLAEEAPRNSESRALAYAIRLIRRIRPAVKWIQSFADERCGLFGTVYQAAGFTFHGEHLGRFWELDGEWYHDSLMTQSSNTGPRAMFLRQNRDRATKHLLRQFRYLRFLQVRFARSCRYPVLPYPKPDYEARAPA